MIFDTRTVFFFLFLTNWLLAGSLFFACGRHMRRGEAMWSASLAVQGAGIAFILARGTIPLVVSVVAGNGLISASLSLAYLSVCRIFERRPSWLLCLAPLAAVLVCMAAFEDVRLRVLSLGILCAFQELVILVTLVRRDVIAEGGRAIGLLIAGYAAGALVFVLRALAASSVPRYVGSSFPPNVVDSGTLSLGFAGIIMTAFGVLLIHRQFMERETERLATLDSLTGVFNRRMLIDLAGRALAFAKRRQQSLALLMIDLDEFKRINDRHGHRVGDRVLAHVVKCIREQLRPQDLLGRYGGEEFCVVMPATDMAGAQSAAGRVRLAVEKHPMALEEDTIRMTVSIGVAVTDGNPDADFEALMTLADHTMYEAKAYGRNRIIVKPLAAETAAMPAPGRLQET